MDKTSLFKFGNELLQIFILRISGAIVACVLFIHWWWGWKYYCGGSNLVRQTSSCQQHNVKEIDKANESFVLHILKEDTKRTLFGKKMWCHSLYGLWQPSYKFYFRSVMRQKIVRLLQVVAINQRKFLNYAKTKWNPQRYNLRITILRNKEPSQSRWVHSVQFTQILSNDIVERLHNITHEGDTIYFRA